MARYIARPRAGLIYDQDFGPAATAEQIILADEDFAPTGLLNERGDPLYRCREKIRLGFQN